MDIQADMFDAKQMEAVEACCDPSNRVVSVHGEAGTGKTSIMRAVYHRLVEAGYTVALCAPTGKAAKRIFEATGIRAVTIHSLLEYSHPGERDPKTGEALGESLPKRDRKNRLVQDFVLADEYMMVGQELHRNLFDALKMPARIRVFGDLNQLPPIEKIERLRNQPAPFETLINTKGLVAILLETIHRQSEGSGIVANGARINAGRVPQRLDDFTLCVTSQPVDKVCDLVLEYEDHGVDFSSINNQIITPTNKTWIGTQQLNTKLQQLLRPETDGWYELPRHSWVKQKVFVRAGDKVIITSNNYDIRPEHEKWYIDDDGKTTFIPPTEVDKVFNGESGILQEVTDFGELIIDLGDRTVTIPPELEWQKKKGDRIVVLHFDPRKDVDLAYAITTHKSQGSEYDNVIYMLNKSCKFMQSRRNFYTGITRAKKNVIVVTDQGSLSHSVWKRQ